MATLWTALFLLIAAVIGSKISNGEASVDIGVCFGLNGDNLPAAPDVIGLYKKYGIAKIRLFEPNAAVLEALRGSQIEVTLGTLNADIPNLASSQDAANSWFASNVEPYLNDVVFKYITVGNEVVPGQFSQSIEAALRNFQTILDNRNLTGIKVTTVLSGESLGASYPPSSGAFTAEASTALSGILNFLTQTSSPLMINVYPYFAYAANPKDIRLDYAQFTASGPIVVDGPLSYSNLFDAIVDAFFSAMEKLGATNVNVVVSESGWPSAGNGEFTTPELAGTYNQNFKDHVLKNGTPKRPQAHIEGFIFAIFEEDLKPAGVEQHFGLFNPTNLEPVYSVF